MHPNPTGLALLLSLSAALILTSMVQAGDSDGKKPAYEAQANAPQQNEADKNAAPLIEQQVDVWGKRVHFRIQKGSKYTILLESGAGLDSTEWTHLAPRIATATGASVLSYDRSGKGKSDALEAPYSIYDEMMRLHAALYTLGHNKNLILVGHSYGGFLIQVYANMYPGDISGLVYVDANTVRGIKTIGPDKLKNSVIKRNDVPEPTSAQASFLRMGRAYSETFDTISQFPVICGVPVAVITAGKTTPGIDQKIIDDWRGGHADLVAKTNGMHFMAYKSGHMIPRDQPEIVIKAIKSVLKKTDKTAATLSKPGQTCQQ